MEFSGFGEFFVAHLILGVMYLEQCIVLCCSFIVQYQNFSGHSFIKRLSFGIEDKLVGSSVAVFVYEPSGFRLIPFVFRGFRKQRSLWLATSAQGSQSGLASGM
ncbi:hypothetical protein C9I89_22015 [Photobacterium lipolyticum]|uniref:Uncharacterized protein n=1 Tax=Photobacterium lipolyticum TaxID=266810 RepID=A0A2T3MPL0_9GAMM|nr:hypothetical protein C9I89_22015 [Photobacterium lipolyticum]